MIFDRFSYVRLCYLTIYKQYNNDINKNIIYIKKKKLFPSNVH